MVGFRCGGQGDVLSGLVATSLHWSLLLSNQPNTNKNQQICKQDEKQDEDTICEVDIPPSVLSCLVGSILTKRAALSSFELHGRASTTPDIIQQIGNEFKNISEENKEN